MAIQANVTHAQSNDFSIDRGVPVDTRPNEALVRIVATSGASRCRGARQACDIQTGAGTFDRAMQNKVQAVSILRTQAPFHSLTVIAVLPHLKRSLAVQNGID